MNMVGRDFGRNGRDIFKGTVLWVDSIKTMRILNSGYPLTRPMFEG